MYLQNLQVDLSCGCSADLFYFIVFIVPCTSGIYCNVVEIRALVTLPTKPLSYIAAE